MASPHFTPDTKISDGTNTHLVMNHDSNPIQGQTWDSESQVPQTSQVPPQPGARYVTPSFTEIAPGTGAAGVAAPIGVWLTAAGMSEALIGGTSATYVADGDFKTNLVRATYEQNEADAVLMSASNAVTNVALSWRPDQPVLATVNLFGTYTDPTEAAGSDALITYANPQVSVGLTATLGGDALIVQEFDFNLNNVITDPLFNMNATEGVANPEITNYNPTLEALFIFPDFSTANYWTNWRAVTKEVVSIVIGGTAGNILTCTGDFYHMELIETGTSDGLMTARLRLKMSKIAADTQWTMAYT